MAKKKTIEATGGAAGGIAWFRRNAARLIYQGYPHPDLLPVDPAWFNGTVQQALAAIQAGCHEGSCGDTLFLFLLREADDEIDAAEYLRRLDRAMRDIERVRAAVAGAAPAAADNRSPPLDVLIVVSGGLVQSVFARKETGVQVIDFDNLKAGDIYERDARWPFDGLPDGPAAQEIIAEAVAVAKESQTPP